MNDISDKVWAILEPLLPGQRGQWGGIAQDNRRFINAVFWILRTGAPWRDLPESYGKWRTVHQRFRRWRNNGTWEKILEALIDEPDYEWLMIDASHCKVHPDASGAKGGNQDMSRTKGGSIPRFIWPWIRSSLKKLLNESIFSISFLNSSVAGKRTFIGETKSLSVFLSKTIAYLLDLCKR